jgi:predicted flap endonuclease-1-like 5' DNA nuclease
MAWLTEVPGMGAAEDRVKKALSFPVGAASPLWLAFGAAASAGVAFWWMTRWTKPENLEAAFAIAKAPVSEAAEVVQIIAETLEAETEEAMEALAPEPEPALVEAAEAEPEAVVASESESEIEAAPDDLTRLVGIGPKLSDALAARGVTRFAQIAAWTTKDLAEIDAALSLKGRAVRDAWVAQAARLAATE